MRVSSRLLAVGVLGAIKLFACLAQRDPATLTFLNHADAAEDTQVVSEPEAKPPMKRLQRPPLTVTRPDDGFQHPDLDKAWAEYAAKVAKAADSIRAAITNQFETATANGNLDAAVRWQAALARFDEAGALSAETEKNTAVKAALADYKKAKHGLEKEYGALVKALTIDKKIEDAEAVQNEQSALMASVKQAVEAEVVVAPNRKEPKPAPPVKNGGATEAQQPERGTKVTYTNTVGIAFVHIPAVRFQLMGKATRLTRPYKIAITEVTQQQWEKVMGTTPWKGMPEVLEGPELPATFVSHDDAIAFCANLTALEKKAGQTHTYSLPTQTQWMYGCLAGQDAKWCCGNDENCLLNFAVYAGNAGDRGAHRVRTKAANVLGVFDMHGNVREWCLEGPFLGATGGFPGGDDPLGHGKHPRAVTRGGGWKSAAAECSVESATRSSRTEKSSDVGFRVVLF